MHKDAARKNSDPTFKYAHIYVSHEALYILTPEERRGKGKDRRVCAAQ
jgi:hypothetical protein